MARKKKIHHRHNRLSFGGKLAFVLLTILSAVILIPIVFTFLYSFFPQSEITAYLKGRGSYDTTKWLDVLYSPAMFSLRQYYKIFIEEPSYLKLFCNSMMYRRDSGRAGAHCAADGVLPEPLPVPRARFALLLHSGFDDPAVSGHDGAKRYRPAMAGHHGDAVGGHSADVLFALLHLPPASVHGGHPE
mgnify:CR=1 FL=1